MRASPKIHSIRMVRIDLRAARNSWAMSDLPAMLQAHPHILNHIKIESSYNHIANNFRQTRRTCIRSSDRAPRYQFGCESIQTKYRVLGHFEMSFSFRCACESLNRAQSTEHRALYIVACSLTVQCVTLCVVCKCKTFMSQTQELCIKE